MQKIYTAITAKNIGITEKTGVNSIVEGGLLPANTTAILWINDDTQYGREIREEVKKSTGYSVFGYLYIERVYDGTTYFLTVKNYTNHRIFTNAYTTINSQGWNDVWHVIPWD